MNRPGQREAARERLLVFVKWPQPGSVKTRLIPRLGAPGACELYRGMAERTLQRVRRLTQPSLRVVVFVDPPRAVGAVRAWLGADLEYEAQASGDLGERLEAAFDAAFRRGAERVVAIGTDCPELDAPLVAQAFLELSRVQAVVGPAVDGGYYLLGLSRPCPRAFRGIAWSSPRVLDDTLERLHSSELTVAALAELRDLDTPDDLDALVGDVSDLLPGPARRRDSPLRRLPGTKQTPDGGA